MPTTVTTPDDAIREPLAVLTCRELVRTFGLFERVMQPYFAGFGISGSQWGVLRHLSIAERQGLAGLRGADLSERLLIRPPSVTGVIERLLKSRLVERVESPGDQRARPVRLTARGRRLVARIQSAHVGQMTAVAGGLSPAKQQKLRSLLAEMGRRLHSMVESDRVDSVSSSESSSGSE